MKKLLLILGLLLVPTAASAQCTGVFGANTLCGNLSATPAPPKQFSASTSIVGPGSSTIGDVVTFANTFGNQLADSGILATNLPTLSGTNTFTGTNNFNPAPASLNQAINVTQTSPAGSVVGPLSFNLWNVTDNEGVTGASPQTSAFRINYNVGGSAVTGGPRIGAYFNTLNSIAGSTATVDKIGAVGSCDTIIDDSAGGGGCYGLNSFGGVGATGKIARLVGFESDVSITSGGVATNRYALSAVNLGAGQGGTLDSAFFVANIGSSAGAFKNLLVLSNLLGAAPLTTTANLFSSDTAFTINDIFHFANATINGDIINAPNVILTGAGALTLLGGVSNPTGNGQGSFGASAAGGVTVIGQGSSFDFELVNSAGNAVCTVATGTRILNCNTVGSTNPFVFNGTAGITQTCTVNQAKTLVFTGGILTSGSCNS